MKRLLGTTLAVLGTVALSFAPVIAQESSTPKFDPNCSQPAPYSEMAGPKDWNTAESMYNFTVKNLDGEDVSLEKYRGNVVIVINVASYCGLTKTNYKQLNELYAAYQDKGLRVAAFPCNQFNNQEPGCSTDLKEFMTKNEVKFDVYAKINVNGDDAHPLYKWLKSKQGGSMGVDSIKWNFTKFLINKEGIPVNRYAPTTEPASMEEDLKKLL